MFDWFWKFLYSISKTIYQACDAVMSVGNRLIGIEDITISGSDGSVTNTDFLSYLLNSENIRFAYDAISILAVVIVVLFSVIAILRAAFTHKVEDTPAKISFNAFKSLLMFFFIPAVFYILTIFLNTFMKQVYAATLHGSNSIGSFLFCAFAQDAGLSDGEMTKFLTGEYSYLSTGTVASHIDISDYSFILSWLVGIIVLWNLGSTILMFVDRAISIVILYIAAPFSIASSILDDGSRFKQWREQVISKYIGGYGSIIAINIYCLITAAVSSSTFNFVPDNSFLNYIAKILIILGGAVTMKKSMGLVASLVSQSAAQDMNDPAFRGNALARAALAPFKAARGIYNFGQDTANRGLGHAIGSRLGLKDKYNYQHDGKSNPYGGGSKNGESSENKNDSSPNYQSGASLNDALEGGNDSKGNDNGGGNNGGSDNTNSNKPSQNTNNQLLNNALAGNGDGNESKNNNKKEEDDE